LAEVELHWRKLNFIDGSLTSLTEVELHWRKLNFIDGS